MKYDWEEKHDFKQAIEAADATLPDGLHVIGVIVENAETAEAAIAKHPDLPGGGILMCDLWQDVLSDARRIYNEAVKKVFPVGGA